MNHRMNITFRMVPVALALSALLVASACSGSGQASGGGPDGGPTGTAASGQSTPPGTPHRGGNLTVLEQASYAGGYPSGLDPATNTTGGANLDQQQAIFGGLFLLRSDPDGSNGHVAPYQARSYTFTDGGKTLTIKIRPGITFSDGTPFDAKAVAWNFKRDAKSSCTCAPQWKLAKKDPITVAGPLTVVLRFSQPSPSLIASFPVSNVNWIASPTAFKKMGEAKFKVKPVGAGPFTVVSDSLSDELVVKRNPNFFKKGQPYLDGITFKSIGSEQAAYQAMLAGNGDVTGLGTPPIIKQAQQNSKFTVTIQPGSSPYVIQLNTFAPPFNNIKAREAIYYATDWKAIDKGIFGNKYPITQSFTAPADKFYHQNVPGYRTFDLAKAKALVKELGGLKVTLGTLKGYIPDEIDKALQTQWKQAGMDVQIESWQLNTLIKEFNSKKWQAMLQTAGAWDPAAGIGVAFRFASTSPFTGVKDPKLDTILNQAASILDSAKRDQLYQQASKYISDHAYAPFGLAIAGASVVDKGIHGPGLTTKEPSIAVAPQTIWSEVYQDKG